MNKTFTVTRTVTEDAIDNNNHMHIMARERPSTIYSFYC